MEFLASPSNLCEFFEGTSDVDHELTNISQIGIADGPLPFQGRQSGLDDAIVFFLSYFVQDRGFLVVYGLHRH